MSLETRLSLSDDTLSLLRELTQINLDSVKGFREVSSHTDDQRIVTLFQELSDERARQAEELRQLISRNGQDADIESSYSGAAHRAWINLKSHLGANGAASMLTEAERGEDVIKGKYENLIKQNPGTAVSDVLHRQYVQVKKAHDRVRDLRDEYNKSSDKS